MGGFLKGQTPEHADALIPPHFRNAQPVVPLGITLRMSGAHTAMRVLPPAPLG